MKNKQVKQMLASVYSELCWEWLADCQDGYFFLLEEYRPFILLKQVESM